MFYLFILSFTMMSYITMAPSFLYANIYNDDKGIISPKVQKIISLLYFVSLFLFMPAFCFNFFYLSLRINKILYIKVLSLILISLESLTTIFAVKNEVPYLYYFSFLFTILAAYILEDQLIYFYTQIIPTNFELMKIKGITVINVMRYLGSIFGSLSSVFGFALYEDKDNFPNENETNEYEENLIVIENSFSIIVQSILIAIFLKNSKTFSDRPIRRIVFSKNPREIRRTEF